MAQQVGGVARRQGGGVVTDDGHAVPDGVVPSGVSAEVFPAPAFVHVAVGADDEAEGATMLLMLINFVTDMKSILGKNTAHIKWR